MKILKAYLLVLTLLFMCGSIKASTSTSRLDGDSPYQPYAPDGIPFVIANEAWKADMQGNHRAVVEVSGMEKKATVLATLPWRRADLRADSKKVIVVDALTGQNIKNVSIRSFSSDMGKIAFEAVSGNGLYYIYYLPYQFRKGWNDARYGKPWDDYLPAVYESDATWAASLSGNLPQGKVLRFESRTRFDAFTPMGTTATQAETDRLLALCKPGAMAVFTEDRAFPIRLTEKLPFRWIQNGFSDSFKGDACRNEYYTWQIGVWAAHKKLSNVKLAFSDFRNGTEVISKKSVTCFNQEGINWDGNPINFSVNVPQNKIQALWCGMQIPEKAKTGVYKGTVTLSAAGMASKKIAVEITVEKEVLADKGDGDLWRHARLRWLNSTIGLSNSPVAPYQAMTVKGNLITATEKRVQIAKNGLPESIVINGQQVLSSPMKFVITTDQGEISFNATNARLQKKADGLVVWNSLYEKEGLVCSCKAEMAYDGYIHYELQLSSKQNRIVKDIRLETLYTPYASTYFMGAGTTGGYRPTAHQWDWKGPWDSYWMGGAQAGLHMEFRGGSYHGPLLNDYKPLAPRSWANNGKGKITVAGNKDQQASVIASTGTDTLSAKAKSYEFDLMITPMKPVNSGKHFSERYFHALHTGFDKAAEEGANIINIHHAKPLNPVINYPFIVRDSLVTFIQHEHQYGRKVKLYYTIRELSNYAQEIYALKSLNNEIFAPGPGYGVPWHHEHLIDGYRPAWYTELPGEASDAALVLSGFSRWINYYLEGLRWMFENYDLDGIYMDDVSFDRPVMKRMRKIIETYKPSALIDLHSNTGYSVGPANQYAGFFPYIDRLWFGENFKYNKMTPDEWFVTFSGIPFGMMSEMLQDGGNRFLGMVYGTTARHSYGEYTPAPVWKLWKEFGIEQAQMMGYWDERCAITANSSTVKVTTYVKKDKVLIAIGNFDPADQTIQLSIDWKKLKLNPAKVTLTAPYVEDFQKESKLSLQEPLTVKAKEGCLLILSAEK